MGRENLVGGKLMTKEEAVNLLVLIESVYPKCIFKDETVQQWFQFCTDMDYEKVLTKLKNHIRKSPFPPVIRDIAVFYFEENHFPAMLQEWMKAGPERIECDTNSNKRGTLPAWLSEYSTRKSD
jgi:Loader and inhibitor of phage G40P